MQMRGFSARTHASYLLPWNDLARFFGRSPETLESTELNRYFASTRQGQDSAENMMMNPGNATPASKYPGGASTNPLPANTIPFFRSAAPQSGVPAADWSN